MFFKNFVVFFMMIIALVGCGSQQKERLPCASKEACLNDPDCLCWCSQVCNYRKKTAKDHPVYVENDPNGKFCYCKQWDLDNYEDNCILNRGIKQPEGAE